MLTFVLWCMFLLCGPKSRIPRLKALIDFVKEFSKIFVQICTSLHGVLVLCVLGNIFMVGFKFYYFWGSFCGREHSNE